MRRLHLLLAVAAALVLTVPAFAAEEKAAKGKVEKTDKGKGEKVEKGKTDKADKADKSDKTEKSDKTDKADKDEKADADEKPADPVKVKVGVYVLNVGKYELATGTYTVDFYLSLQSDKDMGDQRFEFMNGRGSLDKLIDKPTEKFYRVQGNLMTNVDLRTFPWDSHVLPIVIEHVTRTAKEVVYEVDQEQSGVDAEVRLVGWELKKYSAMVREHYYPVYKENYSQYVYQLEVGRVIFASSLKTFLPVVVFLIVTLVSLLIAVEKADARITMNTALLIAAVMFHLSIQSSLPPVGYLTLADKVMIATYAVIGTNLGVAVFLMRLVLLKQEQRAQAMRKRAFFMVPIVALLAYGTALLTF